MKKLFFSVLFIFSTLGLFGRAYSADAVVDVGEILLEGGEPVVGLERPITRRAPSTLREGLSGLVSEGRVVGKNGSKGGGEKLALPLEKTDEKSGDGN